MAKVSTPLLYKLIVVHSKGHLTLELRQDDKSIYKFNIYDQEKIVIEQSFVSYNRTDIPIISLKDMKLTKLEGDKMKIVLPQIMNMIVSDDEIEIDKDKDQYFKNFKLCINSSKVNIGTFEIEKIYVCGNKSKITILNSLTATKFVGHGTHLITKEHRDVASLTNKGKMYVNKLYLNGVFDLRNEGELNVSTRFYQGDGDTLNKGTWNQTGTMVTNSCHISNQPNGYLMWKDLNWVFNSHGGSSDIMTLGETHFDNVSSTIPIHIHGFCAKIQLKNSKLHFSWLIGSNIHCISGQYTIKALQNNQQMQFDNDWIITDDSTRVATDGSNFIYIRPDGYGPKGDMLHNGKLECDMVKLPNSINGSQLLLSERCQKQLTLFDMNKFTSKSICLKNNDSIRTIKINDDSSVLSTPIATPM